MRGCKVAAAVAVGFLLVHAGVTAAQDTAAGSDSPSSPAPESRTAADTGVIWDSGSVRFEADAFELRVGDRVFRGIGPAEVRSDPGDEAYRTLEVVWSEQGVEQRMNLYFGADESDWWISEVRTYDGFVDGEWIDYLQVGEMDDRMLSTPRGSSYEGDVQFVGWGRVPGELLVEGLRLTAFAPGTGPAAHTDCRFAVAPGLAESVRPTDEGQPLDDAGIEQMSAAEVEAVLRELGVCFEFRYSYPTGPEIDGSQEGYSERWCTAPPAGRVEEALYGGDGAIIIFVEDDEIRDPREQPPAGWGCPAND